MRHALYCCHIVYIHHVTVISILTHDKNTCHWRYVIKTLIQIIGIIDRIWFYVCSEKNRQLLRYLKRQTLEIASSQLFTAVVIRVPKYFIIFYYKST